MCPLPPGTLGVSTVKGKKSIALLSAYPFLQKRLGNDIYACNFSGSQPDTIVPKELIHARASKSRGDVTYTKSLACSPGSEVSCAYLALV